MSKDVQPAPTPAPTPAWMLVIGWIISLLPGLAILALAITKLTRPDLLPQPEGFDPGWHADAMFALTVIEIVGAVLYLFPPTATLGAVILTGYLGGAVATHVRIGDAFVMPFVFGVLLWLGLVFRDARLRAMLPFRRLSPEPAGPSGCMTFIGVVFLTLLLVVGMVAGISQALPTDYSLSRTQAINAKPADVFPLVVDFNQWKTWIPFGKGDEGVTITIDKPGQVGSTYKWTSEGKSGVGMMTITDIVPNERVKIHLEFEKPLKSEADAEFLMKTDKGQTMVTWSMAGKSDPLHKTIRGAVSLEKELGALFREGLDALKAAAEKAQPKGPSDGLPD